jgi:hypothetical protein
MDQPYDEVGGVLETPPLEDEDVSKAILMGARQGLSGCHGYVELEDLVQVCWLDRLEKPGKYRRYEARGDFTGLVKEMVRTAGVYAQREKANALGYKPEDLFFYSRRVLREVIPAILNSWSTGELYEFEYRDRALWMDIDGALKKMADADLQMIRWAFEDDRSVVAGKLGISEDAASMRVGRLLDKVRQTLGGENPTPRRRTLSNAASQAANRNAWDGGG